MAPTKTAPQRKAARADRLHRARSGLLHLFYKKPGKLDAGFTATVVILLIFGLVMLFSASYATGYLRKGNSFFYIKPQVKYALLGLAIMLAASLLDYHKLRRYLLPMYVGTLILLVAVLFMPPIHNHRRWINIRGLPTLQVSEIAKFVLVVALANMMAGHQSKMRTFKEGVLRPAAITGILCLFILPETHYSAIMLMLCIMMTMMWAGGTDGRLFALGGLGVGAVAGIVLLTGRSYVATRFQGWLDPFADVYNTTRQTAQSLYAVGSGGLFGLGIGNSRQKYLWLPEATNDFIFSILCEELGFVGALLCMGLFAALIIQGIRIALRAPDRFGSLIVIGIMAQIGWQLLFNIAVVTNSMPNTGISLPFFSSGGTSLVMLLGEMGVVLSIARAGNAAKRDKANQQAGQAKPTPVQ